MTHRYQRPIPQVKSINYLMGIWLQENLRNIEAYDALYYSECGVTELPKSNFFIVTEDDCLITADDHVLQGINRGKLIEIAKKHFKIEVRKIEFEELKTGKRSISIQHRQEDHANCKN